MAVGPTHILFQQALWTLTRRSSTVVSDGNGHPLGKCCDAHINNAVRPRVFFDVVEQVAQDGFQEFGVSRDAHRIIFTVESIAVVASIHDEVRLGNQCAQQQGGRQPFDADTTMPTPVINILRTIENMTKALDSDDHAGQAFLALSFVIAKAKDVEVGTQDGEWRAIFVGDEVDEPALAFVQLLFTLNVLGSALGVFQCLAMGLAQCAVALAQHQMQCNDEAQGGDLQVVLQGVKGRINAQDVQYGDQKTDHAKQVGDEQQAAASVLDAPEEERAPKADTHHQ
ncbi:MAG: hypothetical protein QG599_2622 [Pseudomonadota bacterium]|nr:hypothetical protein [Pseudomonadota bacterium]